MFFFIFYLLIQLNVPNLTSYFFSGLAYLLVILFLRDKKLSFAHLAGISVLFRLVFFSAIPNLSQDFYRFIWDGRMILEGLNPYLSLPQTFIEQHNYPINQAKDLYEGMGALNGSHYTNYPPVNQLCFWYV